MPTIRLASALLEHGLICEQELPEITKVAERYAVAVTPTMQRQIVQPGDPVAKQFIPSALELANAPEELEDPIADTRFTPVKGITHRYPDRVLLKITHMCPVYCRFCFRREVVGPGQQMLTSSELNAALDYIRANKNIWEVIFSGGDPLIMPAKKLLPIMTALDEIEHVKVVRFHTRVPIVSPDQVTAELIDVLSTRTPVWIVVHTNHSQEIGEAAQDALYRLSMAGLPLLSQTVLLKGINDTPQALEDLFRTLVANRVKPYYLHHGDLAKGTSHFRTSIRDGQRLMRHLRGNTSGTCQPLYVLDIPGGHGKVPIGPSYIEAVGDGYAVTDPWGAQHTYPPRLQR